VGADGKTHFPIGRQEFAAYAPRFLEAGVTFIGGCCGTRMDKHVVDLGRLSAWGGYDDDGGREFLWTAAAILRGMCAASF